MEEDFILLSYLDNISRISFEIQVIYSKLTLLEVSKDITEDYESQKKNLLDSLFLLLEEEKGIYEYLESHYYQAEYSLDYLQKRFKDTVPPKFRLVQKRIIRKIESIILKGAVENQDEEYLEEFLEEEFFTDLFFDKDYSIEDLIPLITGLTVPIDISLDRNYIVTLNEGIKNPDNFDIRRLLLNIKYDYIYEHSGSIEQECLAQGFNHNLKPFLSEETRLPNVPTKIKNDYFNKYLKGKLLDMLIVCGSCTELDKCLEEIAWFKTYLLYLNDQEIKDVQDRLTDHTFQNEEIKDILLRTVQDINTLKTLYNSSKQKSAN